MERTLAGQKYALETRVRELQQRALEQQRNQAEATSFDALADAYAESDAVVLGVSKQSEAALKSQASAWRGRTTCACTAAPRRPRTSLSTVTSPWRPPTR